MNEALVIWGAGGHGTVILDIARDSGNYKHIVFFDDDSSKMNSIVCECAVIGDRCQFDRFAGSAFVIAIGHNQMRARCFELAVASGLTPVALLHRTSVISSMARIGRGTVVMPGAIINSGARVGDNCIINSGAIVEHDCEIGSHVHLSPRAVLGGGARVGTLAHLGLGAVVLPGASIGEESIVGAGAVVLKAVPARTTVVGVPARPQLSERLEYQR
jgi:sugar O-acyltransferase (sialic acid O-acetyltransferase NeuD family)